MTKAIDLIKSRTRYRWALTLSIMLGGPVMIVSVPITAFAQAAPKPVASCWATDAGRQYVRVSWTPANNNNADRYTIRRSDNGGASYQWKSTVSKHARSSIVSESSAGNLRYRVETISSSGVRESADCGPSSGLNHNDTSTPVAVASCWAKKKDNGSIRVTWTPRPNDGADRYTVMQSENTGEYNWVDTVGKSKRESNLPIDSTGNYRFQVRTVARNGAYVVRDCGPDEGVTTTPIGTSMLTVMPIGDSITLGATIREAYRYPMQDEPLYDACGIDLVGSAPHEWATAIQDGSRTPPTGQYAGNEYDHDHASWGGYTVGNLLRENDPIRKGNVLQHISIHQPDIVLLHIGTNDILKNVDLVGTSAANLRKLIDGIKQNSPDTAIFVAKVIRPGNTRFYERVNRWNQIVEETVAAAGHQIRIVDMDAIWPRLTKGSQASLTQAQIDENERFKSLTMFAPEFNYDGVHPSLHGSRVLARQWLNALQDAGHCP